MPESESARIQVLLRAAELIGGTLKLREHLRVGMGELETWLRGNAKIPTSIFLAAVDVVSDDIGTPHDVAARRLGISVADFLRMEFTPARVNQMLELALNAATNETRAPRGNIQLARPEGLRIVSQLGFEKPFLDFFVVVTNKTPASCSRAKELGRSIVIEDVLSDPIFVGTPAADVMKKAGALAVQSTPILDAKGEVLGMLSTHYEKPHRPSARELGAVELICRRAAHWLAPTAA